MPPKSRKQDGTGTNILNFTTPFIEPIIVQHTLKIVERLYVWFKIISILAHSMSIPIHFEEYFNYI